MEHFPDMNKVFSSLIQHERQNSLDIPDDPRMIVNVVNGRRLNRVSS